MDHPYGKQYGQEGNPRAYMTMRDYRNLPYQWGIQQPVGSNPNPPRSMREYRDQWISGPVYSVPSTYPPPPQYDYPEPPFYASPPQSPQSPQPLQSIHPLEQAMLDLNRIMDDYVEANKKIKAHSIVNVEDNSNKKIDGLKDDFEHKWDHLHDSSEDLIDQQQCPLEEENLEEESQEEKCLTETVLVEQAQLQPQEELEVESLEAPEELQDASESSVNFWPWTKEKEITALLTEKSSGHEGTQEPIIQPNPQAIPINLDTLATAQDTKTPLPAAPPESVYILPTPATKSKPAAPAPKGKSNPLSAMQKFKELVAIAQIFATTSNKMANAYIAWHSGWFGCGFGFRAPGPRHF